MDFSHHAGDHCFICQKALFGDKINQSLPTTAGIQSSSHPKKIQRAFGDLTKTKQRKLFKWLNKVLKIRNHCLNFDYYIRLLHLFYNCTQSRVKHKAKRIVLKFLRDIKRPLVIRIKFFKLLAKSKFTITSMKKIHYSLVVTIQARWRVHFHSFNDKTNELKQIWDKSFKAYSEFKGLELNE